MILRSSSQVTYLLHEAESRHSPFMLIIEQKSCNTIFVSLLVGLDKRLKLLTNVNALIFIEVKNLVFLAGHEFKILN